MEVPTSRRVSRINHIFFVDNSLLFYKANLRHWQKLTSLLETYEQASGQRLNKSKTAIFFSRNTPREIKEEILEVSGILVSQRYDTYLGLPALVGKSRIAAFHGIKDRVWGRLQDWKLKFLSQAGKEILLKAVIQAIRTYSMNVFLLPKTLCAEINSLMQNFWWGHKSNESRIHWMSWKRMRLSKSIGGMGFRDRACFNKALLTKQCWQLWNCLDSLMARIMKAKYNSRTIVLDSEVGNKPSYIWRSIHSSHALVKEGLIWRIGNGEKVDI